MKLKYTAYFAKTNDKLIVISTTDFKKIVKLYDFFTEKGFKSDGITAFKTDLKAYSFSFDYLKN